MSPRGTQERAYEKHAWLLLFAVGIGILVFAFMGSAGISASSSFPDAQEFAAPVLGWGIFVLAVSRISYRSGERWAWYVSWYLPAAFAGLVAHDLSVGGVRAQFAPVPALFATISLMGLLLPIRKFFPRHAAPGVT